MEREKKRFNLSLHDSEMRIKRAIFRPQSHSIVNLSGVCVNNRTVYVCSVQCCVKERVSSLKKM